MKYIKTINEFNAGINYYNDFDESLIPDKIIFESPKIEYKYSGKVLGSNLVEISYTLNKVNHDKNSYHGTHPDDLTVTISFMYKKSDDGFKSDDIKMFVCVVGGQNNWLEFSVIDSKVSEIDKYLEYKLSKETFNQFINIYQKIR